jgi:hypothetical protein
LTPKQYENILKAMFFKRLFGGRRIEEGSQEVSKERDFGADLLATAHVLARLQKKLNRDLEVEQQLAIAPIALIKEFTQNWHPDFAPTVAVESRIMYSSEYYPPSVVNGHPHLEEIMKRQGWNFDLTMHLNTEKNTYLGGFSLGSELGYEKQLGNTWYLTLSDGGGTYYFPVQQIKSIKGIGA